MRKVYVVISKGITGNLVNGVCTSRKKAEHLARIASETFESVKIQTEVLI